MFLRAVPGFSVGIHRFDGADALLGATMLREAIPCRSRRGNPAERLLHSTLGLRGVVWKFSKRQLGRKPGHTP